jgi:RimJ/RimL family protein N-acetyltransferase
LKEIPEVHTRRLRLRGHSADDLDAALGIWQNPDVCQFIAGEPPNRSEVWLRLLRYSGLWDFLGYGYWALEERASGRYVGQLGFADFKRGLVGFDGRYPEAGWVIDPEFAGQGFATEAMSAACEWLDATGLHSRSYCLIGPDNKGSISVARKLGFIFGLEVSLGSELVELHTRDSAPS